MANNEIRESAVEVIFPQLPLSCFPITHFIEGSMSFLPTSSDKINACSTRLLVAMYRQPPSLLFERSQPALSFMKSLYMCTFCFIRAIITRDVVPSCSHCCP